MLVLRGMAQPRPLVHVRHLILPERPEMGFIVGTELQAIVPILVTVHRRQEFTAGQTRTYGQNFCKRIKIRKRHEYL
uniref:Uncharacterized protein n=1 Tax=Parascaris univalens TaxID=6257 RepID=A0A914ZW73_PARUN